VTAVRQKKRAVVDSIKGQFGFLDYEVDEGKKLFFHMTEVQGSSYNLYPGDTVEFSIITNHVSSVGNSILKKLDATIFSQRTGKTSACGVIKIQDSSPRPDRLISRIKINSIDESAPRLTAIRAPKGPDGSKGFCPEARLPRIAGKLERNPN
jgi:cold shock CspA family protein